MDELWCRRCAQQLNEKKEDLSIKPGLNSMVGKRLCTVCGRPVNCNKDYYFVFKSGALRELLKKKRSEMEEGKQKPLQYYIICVGKREFMCPVPSEQNGCKLEPCEVFPLPGEDL